jgi:hypothetical protein
MADRLARIFGTEEDKYVARAAAARGALCADRLEWRGTAPADRVVTGAYARRVNCPFYFKIGACRHGDRCSRQHVKPNFSQTLLIPHMYTPLPPGPDGQPVDDSERFEAFYEEVHTREAWPSPPAFRALSCAFRRTGAGRAVQVWLY